MNIQLYKQIGIERRCQLEAMALMLMHKYGSTTPQLIDETKRNYVFIKYGIKITIPKKKIKEFETEIATEPT